MAIRLSSYLKLNRFGIYYFRRVIPLSLRELFKRREIYRSLRTSKGTLQLGSAGIQNAWAMKRDNMTPAYTTRWDELAMAVA